MMREIFVLKNSYINCQCDREMLINPVGGDCLGSSREVFQRNVKDYRTTPEFNRFRALLKVIGIVLEHF